MGLPLPVQPGLESEVFPNEDKITTRSTPPWSSLQDPSRTEGNDMATNVLLPQWGMNMEDGTLTKWLVSEGDEIAQGQPLVEVETAKINSELESPAGGIVAHIIAAEGSLAKVGDIIAVIGEPGENPPRPEPGAASPKTSARRRPRRPVPRGGIQSRPAGHAGCQETGSRQQHHS